MWRFTRSNGITERFHNKMETISRQAYGSATSKTSGNVCRFYVLRKAWDWGLPPLLAYSGSRSLMGADPRP
jgi:hypothetical protein